MVVVKSDIRVEQNLLQCVGESNNGKWRGKSKRLISK